MMIMGKWGYIMNTPLSRETLRGLPVLCQKTQKKIGIVEDVIYIPGGDKVEGIIVVDHKLISKRFFIALEKILAFGQMAVIVEDGNQREVQWGDSASVLGRTIIRDDGKELGIISDIVFDPIDGQVEGYEISRGVVDDLISGRNILPYDSFPDSQGEVVIISAEQSADIKPGNRGIKNILSNPEIK